jgi:type IV pilus assembly protein PilE
MRRPPPACRGFTLVEVMIAVVLVAILAAVALPSFLESIRKGRRSEAFNALAAVQQAEERWRSNHSAYTASLADLGVASPTAGGRYTIALGASSVDGDSLATAYVASAAGVDGTSQAADTECRLLSVRLRGGVVEYAGCGACASFTYAAGNACWSR